MHNIGALCLDTQPLKYSLKSEAASWKAQFAKNLHKKGSEDLRVGLCAIVLQRMCVARTPLLVAWGRVACQQALPHAPSALRALLL